MLEYTKLILSKISFDPRLFQKELKKARSQMNERDFRALLDWCAMRYPDMMENIHLSEKVAS